MLIAINTIFLQESNLESVSYFINKIFCRLAKQYPEHEFLFLVDKENSNLSEIESIIKLLVVSANPKNIFSLKYWYHVKLPLTLRSIRPDVLVQPYGYYSLFTRVPQLLVVHDLALKQYRPLISSLYYGRIFGQFLKNSKRIVALSESCKGEIVGHFKVDPGKVDVIPGAAKDIYQPVTYALQQEIKERYAAGKEYFLYTGDYQLKKNLVNLLKAFSQFKKWQQSNMNLLIVKGRSEWNKEVLERLKLYKHRSEVVLLNDPLDEELANITASAYAILFPSISGGLRVNVIDAMQCGAPVIMEGIASMVEDNGGVFLYADAEEPESIAQQMLKLYKDESLRFRLIEEGKLQALQFNWDKSATMIWQSILKVIGQ
jgi:glycosyltransferase involved in cell wall biosynthesis